MANITFEKVAKPRPESDRGLRRDYDYKILVDDKHVATWVRSHLQRGYSLVDISGRAVRRKAGPRGPFTGIYAPNRAAFLETYYQYRDAIPSREDIKERNEAEVETQRQHAERRAAEESLQRVKDTGPALLAAATVLLAKLDNGNPIYYEDARLLRDAVALANGDS